MLVTWMERHQVLLYIAGLAVGAYVGLALPAIAAPATHAINPVLALLLFVTFLGIPFARLGEAVRDGRFLATVLVLNFIVAPVIAWVLSRIVAADQALLVGVLLVLLAPCIDYVIVFAGLAGGNEARLLATAPVLMLVQMLLLPLYLLLFVGPGVVGAIDFTPFIESFLVIIVVPLLAAGAVQFAAARTRIGTRIQRGAMTTMVPLMVLTLAIVVASQIAGVGRRWTALILAVPVYVLFVVVMIPVGVLTARIARLDVASSRSVVFSGVTRNSLVVLPLALALPGAFDLAPLAVVTQTLVELVAMLVMIRLVPRLVR